jgi:Uma2 family endonuclease
VGGWCGDQVKAAYDGPFPNLAIEIAFKNEDRHKQVAYPKAEEWDLVIRIL